MKEIKTEIIIQAPREKVWQTLLDFPAYGDWNPFIRSIEGKAAVGEKLTNTMMNGKKEMVFKPVVTRCNPGQAFEWMGSGMLGMFKGRHYFELEDVGEGKTKLRHGEQFSGLLSGIIMRMIGETTLDSFQKMNRALRDRVEAG